MAVLNDKLKDFLIRNQSQLKYRKFLIGILTKVYNRNALVVNSSTIGIVSNGLKDIEIKRSLTTPIKPDLKDHLTQEQVKQLDPIDKWIYDKNIPMVKEVKDLYKLFLEVQNFSCLSDADKASADEASKSLRGIDNIAFAENVLQEFIKDKELVEVILVIDEQTQIPYLAEFRLNPSLLRAGLFQMNILTEDVDHRLMSEIDTLDVTPADIINLREPVTTTVGRIIINQICLVDPFGKTIPFENKALRIDDGDMIDAVTKSVISNEVTVEQYKRFMDGMFYLGHLTELCTPGLDEHALTTDPELAKRKQELLEQYKGQLNDPLVMAKIEDELIAMDKQYMAGDNALRFYIPLGGKSFDLWRKKMYITVGGIEAFDKDSSKYDFVRNSLEEGITLKDLPKYGNESRKGSYQRGHETRNGGALTKYIVRAFHDSRIVEDDCGTHRGVPVDFNKVPIKKFKGRFILIDGEWTEITDENINKIKIQSGSYLMRSPQFCQCTKGGYCYKCMGRMFSDMNIQQLTMNVVDISTTFMNAAMKNMHGSKLAVYDITSLDAFVL